MYRLEWVWRRWRAAVRPLIGGWLLVGLLVAGCGWGGSSTAEPSNLTLDELPIGLGRGYLTAGLDGIDNDGAGLQYGETAPNFRLQTDDGRHFSLADLQGRPVLINFWATWCPPCRREMPDIVQATTTHPELVVLAVNVQEEQALVQDFAEAFQMDIPVVRDAEGTVRDIYEIRGMPTSVFIDKNGKIATVWTGFLTPELLDKFVTGIE